MWHIASVSFGKDSLYMLLRLIETGAPLDEVVFYDTGMEFQAVYDTRDAVLPLLAAHGIKYTELRPPRSFTYDMLAKPICKRGTKITHKWGFGWCGACGVRWATRHKLDAIKRHERVIGIPVKWYVGIAADEPERLVRLSENKTSPLAAWGVTELEALQGCYAAGFHCKEDDKRLYDYLNRVSCWCCGYTNLKNLKNMYLYFPGYWMRLKVLQAFIDRPMKGPGKSVFDLEARFAEEVRHDI